MMQADVHSITRASALRETCMISKIPAVYVTDVHHTAVCRRILCETAKQLRHADNAMVLRTRREGTSDGNGFAMILIPGQKTRVIGFRKTLLIEPRIPRSHVCIDKRFFGIGGDFGVDVRKQIAHLLAAYAWRETGYQRQGFGAAIHLPNGPLNKCSAEYLRAG